MTNTIDGKTVAASLIASIKTSHEALERGHGVKAGLAVIIVGDDPASHAYVGAKGRMAKECGFQSAQYTLPEETSEDELLSLIADLNADDTIHGILVQLPLPATFNANVVIQSISPAKDVDGLHVVNAGKVATGDFETGLVPCTPAGAMTLVRQCCGDDLSGLNAVVVGRSNLFGKPMVQLLLAANATVTTAHSRTTALPLVCRNADILVAAVGQAEMIKADWVKPGATVIDVGINRVASSDPPNARSRLVGDVAFAECAKIAGAITPVPGGVGPMTIAMLMNNTLLAASRASMAN